MSIDMDKQVEISQSLNSTLEQLNAISACGPNCQRERKIRDLKQAYQTALQNNENKGESLKEARKNYFKYAFGEGYYNDKERDFLEKEANEHVEKLKIKQTKLLDDVKDQQNEKSENEIAIKRMNQLHDKYDTSNDTMLNTMDNKEAVVETSQRQVYYTMQKLDRINFYRKIVSFILKLLLFLSLFYFIYSKKYVSLIIIIVSYLLIRHFS